MSGGIYTSDAQIARRYSLSGSSGSALSPKRHGPEEISTSQAVLCTMKPRETMVTSVYLTDEKTVAQPKCVIRRCLPVLAASGWVSRCSSSSNLRPRASKPPASTHLGQSASASNVGVSGDYDKWFLRLYPLESLSSLNSPLCFSLAVNSFGPEQRCRRGPAVTWTKPEHRNRWIKHDRIFGPENNPLDGSAGAHPTNRSRHMTSRLALNGHGISVNPSSTKVQAASSMLTLLNRTNS